VSSTVVLAARYITEHQDLIAPTFRAAERIRSAVALTA
jgi:hypothetical protein